VDRVEHERAYLRALDLARSVWHKKAKALAAWNANPSPEGEDAYLLAQKVEDAAGEELDKARLVLGALEARENGEER